MTIADNVQHVCAQIADAASRAGRQPSEVRLVAVTKTQPIERVLDGYAAGLRDFGENRVQEAEEKIAVARAQTADARWHLIGQLQRNKVKAAVEFFDMIHSVDSARLAETINQRCAAQNQRMPTLLEVNVGGEATKAGFRLDGDRSEFWRAAERTCALPQVDVLGLMTVAPFTPTAEDVRPVFATLRELRDELARRIARPLPHLSMGMSGDFVVAIAEGATLVRIGTAIFGERQGVNE